MRVRGNYLYQRGDFVPAGGFLRELSETDAFTTDVRLAWEFPRKIGQAVLEVRNVLDKRYQFLADPVSLDPRIPRRQVRFSLDFFF